MVQSDYVFHRIEDQPELERLRMIEMVFDPASQRRLLSAGLQSGWRWVDYGLDERVGWSGGPSLGDRSRPKVPQ